MTENKPHSEDVSNSPRIKPTRITNRISSKEFYARFISVFCLWFEKELCINLVENKLKP